MLIRTYSYCTSTQLMLMPLRDMLLASPFASQIAIHRGQRLWPPRSLWTAGASPGASVPQAASSEELASRAVGCRPIDHATGLPSKQSMTGDG